MAGLTRGTVTNIAPKLFFQDYVAPVLLAGGWRRVDEVNPPITGVTLGASVWVSPTTKQSGGGGAAAGAGYGGTGDILDIPVQADGVTAETDLLTDNGLWDFDSSNGYFYEGVVLIFEYTSTTELRVKAAEQYADTGTTAGPRIKRAVNGSDSSVAVASTNMYTQSESWVSMSSGAACHFAGIGSLNGTVSFGIEARRDLFIITARNANQNYFIVAGKLPQNPSAAAVYDNSSAVFIGDSFDGSHNYTWASTTRRGTFRSSRTPLHPVSSPAGPFAYGAEMAFPTQTQVTSNWGDASYALYGYHRSSANNSPKHVQPPNHSLPLVGQAWLWSYGSMAPGGRAPMTHYLPDFLISQIETQPACGGISELRIVTPRTPLTRFHTDEMLPAAVGDTSVGLPPVADDEVMTQMTPFTKYYYLGCVDAGTGSAIAGAGQLMLSVKGQ